MQNKIVQIPVDDLIPYPQNPNKMPKNTFSKLKILIKQGQNYEPLIVRPHPSKKNKFQIINGHHRTEALKQLGHKTADCLVWNVDDGQAQILLATLNRIGGKDALAEKIELVKKLSENFNTNELAKLLPNTKAQIEKLKNIEKTNIKNNNDNAHHLLNPLVFFLNTLQLNTVQAAIEKFMPEKGTKSQKQAEAITKICERAMNTAEAVRPIQ